MPSSNPFDEINERLQRIEAALTITFSEKKEIQEIQEEVPITITEASLLTSLSIPSIYGLVHRRKIPSYRRGKKLYFMKSELITWIKSGRRPANYEMDR